MCSQFGTLLNGIDPRYLATAGTTRWGIPLATTTHTCSAHLWRGSCHWLCQTSSRCSHAGVTQRHGHREPPAGPTHERRPQCCGTAGPTKGTTADHRPQSAEKVGRGGGCGACVRPGLQPALDPLEAGTGTGGGRCASLVGRRAAGAERTPATGRRTTMLRARGTGEGAAVRGYRASTHNGTDTGHKAEKCAAHSLDLQGPTLTTTAPRRTRGRG